MQHSKTPISIAFTTTFYLDGEMADYQEETMMPLNIGDGFLWSDGKRYRVVDRWLSFDHHGHFNESLRCLSGVRRTVQRRRQARKRGTAILRED